MHIDKPKGCKLAPSKRGFLSNSLSGLAVLALPNVGLAQGRGEAGTYAPVIRVTLAHPIPLDRKVFISGSFNEWGLGPRAWPMSMLPDGSYAARLPQWVRGNYEFKFHLGDWGHEGLDERGRKSGNYNANFSPRRTMYEYRIGGWQGITAWPKPDSTAPRGVSLLSDDMSMPQLDRRRRIWVYLPPQYGQAGKRFPVIYLQDGQNVFDKATSFVGEWGVDETLDRLAGQGDSGAIVIAIDNGGDKRAEEFHLVNPDTKRPGKAEAYLRFIVETLKPIVDGAFDTKPDRLNTAIMGASSGASLALLGALKYPDVFGKAAMFSTPLWLEPRLDGIARTANAHRPGAKLWFTAGGREKISGIAEGAFTADLPAMIEALAASGFSRTNQVSATVDPDGEHNETFWARSFETGYKWLFSETFS